jgi:hypothetical protein
VGRTAPRDYWREALLLSVGQSLSYWHVCCQS